MERDTSFPIFYVGDGPDPAVHVIQGRSFTIEMADGEFIDLNPQMVCISSSPMDDDALD
jgi:hypothetical protein